MKIIKADRFGSPIDGYALIMTFFILGVLLHFEFFVISETVTELIEIGCFLLSSLLLIRTGEKLKSKDILGVKEIALGALQLYLLSSVLPKAGTWSVLWFLLIAFYLFCLLDGALALVHSILAKWSADTSDLLSRTESIVAILTGIPVAIFAGIQLLI